MQRYDAEKKSELICPIKTYPVTRKYLRSVLSDQKLDHLYNMGLIMQEDLKIVQKRKRIKSKAIMLAYTCFMIQQEMQDAHISTNVQVHTSLNTANDTCLWDQPGLDNKIMVFLSQLTHRSLPSFVICLSEIKLIRIFGGYYKPSIRVFSENQSLSFAQILSAPSQNPVKVLPVPLPGIWIFLQTGSALP